MSPREELLQIALAYARAGAQRPRQRAVPMLRIGYSCCLIGLFIPVSAYYSTESIESMTTYQMRDAGIFSEEELKIINEIDKINILDDEVWPEALEEKIQDECEAID